MTMTQRNLTPAGHRGRRLLLNAAVLPSPGDYGYRLCSLDEAKAWLRGGSFESFVGYEETAQALERLTGVRVPVNRESTTMAPKDEALVFRLVFPPGTRRPADTAKGALGLEYIEEHCQTGLLRRIR